MSGPLCAMCETKGFGAFMVQFEGEFKCESVLKRVERVNRKEAGRQTGRTGGPKCESNPGNPPRSFRPLECQAGNF